MNCLIVINTLSGNSQRLDIKRIIAKHTHPDDNITVKTISAKRPNWSAEGYNKIVVCGGDGTLFHALNNCNNSAIEHLVYVACGTFNESCKTNATKRQLGRIDDSCFSYVLAAGSFTDIGYTTNTRWKKKFKILAYLGKVLSSYKVHNFGIDITLPNRVIHSRATLVMFLQGKQCFGLSFNKMYNQYDNKMYMLLVNSYGKDNFFNRIRLFFPLFRIFFVGIRKPIDNNRIFFSPIDSATVNLPQPTDFCIDGEKVTLSGSHTLVNVFPPYRLTIDRHI